MAVYESLDQAAALRLGHEILEKCDRGPVSRTAADRLLDRGEPSVEDAHSWQVSSIVEQGRSKAGEGVHPFADEQVDRGGETLGPVQLGMLEVAREIEVIGRPVRHRDAHARAVDVLDRADWRGLGNQVGRLDLDIGTREGDRLDVLVTLIEAYEARHFPLDLPDPVEAIKYVMEQRNLTAKDLVPYIGQPNRVYEVLNRKRSLTMAMAWKLHKGLGIPAESLIRQAA